MSRLQHITVDRHRWYVIIRGVNDMGHPAMLAYANSPDGLVEYDNDEEFAEWLEEGS